MQFLFPGFLWALAALAVPIIIHLFHFRRFKKVYFTNVHLLQELKEETSASNRLKNFLVLLTRLLALAALVFAFAQPIISRRDVLNEQQKTVAIYIDNSYSMQADRDDVPLLTIAKDQAAEIIKARGDTKQYMILSNELSGKSQRLIDQKTALQFVDDITIQPEVSSIADISRIANRVYRREAPDTQLELYLLSDFQENITQVETPADSTVSIQILPVRAIRENNVALLSAQLEAPVALQNVANPMLIELANYSDADQEVQMRLNYGGRTQPLGIVRVPARSQVTDTISLTLQPQQWHDIVISIDDYPVEFDNRLYLSLETKEQIRLLNIYERSPDKQLRSTAASIPSFELQQYEKNAVKYDVFAQQDLIILNDLSSISTGLSSELVKYVKGGGNLLVFPNQNVDVNTYNNLLQKLNAQRIGEKQANDKKEVSRINTTDFVFADVYRSVKRNLKLPTTQLRYKLQSNTRSDRDVIMSYRDGSPYIAKYNIDGGQLYLCTAPMSSQYNSLSQQAEIYVPMIYKMALSRRNSAPLSYTIGNDELISMTQLPSSSSSGYKVTGPVEFIPQVRSLNYSSTVDVRDQVNNAGHYRLQNGNENIAHLAFNYDRRESDVSYGSLDEIAQRIGENVTLMSNTAMADVSQYITDQERGTPLWRWCLFGALLFLLIESLLLRYWKK